MRKDFTLSAIAEYSKKKVEHIGGNMKNATYLFEGEKPGRKMKNSESRWTAVAQMSLIYLSKKTPNHKLPVYETDDLGYLTRKDDLVISGFSCSNTVCENGLSGDIFNITDFDKNFANVKPDILHVNEQLKKVIFIEVKTLSESVKRNIDLYDELNEYLNSRDWDCKLYYLLSHGHEKPQDWPMLSKHKSNIILWEDLFRLITTTEALAKVSLCHPELVEGWL